MTRVIKKTPLSFSLDFGPYNAVQHHELGLKSSKLNEDPEMITL